MNNFNDDLLVEGVNDKNILKAFFLFGGPGSGKSYVVSKLFGIPEQGIQSISYSTGLKAVNVDTPFELILNKMGISLSDLKKMNDTDFMDKTTKSREKAIQISDKQDDLFRGSRLGLIIQGTGRDSAYVKKTVNTLKELGYDCYGIFVNTSLDVAIKRNSTRNRTMPTELVKYLWDLAQNNIGHMQNIFGVNNFIILDNSDENSTDKIISSVSKKINTYLSKPISNPIGIQWIANQKKINR